MARVRVSQTRKVALAHRLTAPYVRRTADLIAAGARQLAPRGDHRSGSGTPKPGLPLASSIRVTSHTTAMQIRERVSANKRYAASVHQGSQAHTINSRGRMLKFQWERGALLVQARGRGRRNARGRRVGAGLYPRGDFFFFLRVRHPGNKRPVRFLTTPMHLYGRMRGFRTTSTPVSRTRLP